MMNLSLSQLYKCKSESGKFLTDDVERNYSSRRSISIYANLRGGKRRDEKGREEPGAEGRWESHFAYGGKGLVLRQSRERSDIHNI